MAQTRVPVTSVIYFCSFSTLLLILSLMAYMGVFEGLGDALLEIIKPIAKYFFE
jgi:hypothetical protein